MPLWKQHISKRGFPYQSFTNTYQMKIRIAFRCQEEKKTLWWGQQEQRHCGNFSFMHHHLHQKYVYNKYRRKQANCGDFFFIAAKLVTKELYLWEVAPAEYTIKQMQVDPQTLEIILWYFCSWRLSIQTCVYEKNCLALGETISMNKDENKSHPRLDTVETNHNQYA